MNKTELLEMALEKLTAASNYIDTLGGVSKGYRMDIERLKAALEAKDEKDGSPCPEFWDWLPKAYRDGDIGDLPKFTKYNMEVAFLAGKQSVALEAKDEPVNDELRRLHDLLGKANALARIRAAEIESMKASLYGLYELEKQRDELEQRLTKTEAQLGEAVWNYGELKREQLANQQNTSGSPIFSELHCICGAEWEWRNRDWELVATPPQRKPLTDEEINALDYSGTRIEFVRAIEAKLKEKNT